MNRLKKIINLTLFVFYLLALIGCSGYRSAATPSSAVIYTQEEILELQHQFDLYTDNLFIQELEKNSLNLHFKLANPNNYGIANNSPTLGEFTLEIMQQASSEARIRLEELKGIDRGPLLPQQQITYDVLYEYLQTELRLEGMELYTQVLSPTNGIQSQLPVLLAEYRFYSEQDINDYLSLLSQVKIYYGEIIEFEKQKAEAGLFMSDLFVDHIIAGCREFIANPDKNLLVTAFSEKIKDMEDIDNVSKANYVEENRRIIKETVIPAYELLIEGLTNLKGNGKNEKGLIGLERGKEYYEYLVASNTGSERSVKDLKKLIQSKLNQDISLVSKKINKTSSLSEKMQEFTFARKDPHEILEQLSKGMDADFPPLPETNYVIKEVPEAMEHSLGPAFYLIPPIDDYNDNVIFINNNPRYKENELYPVLAHEGYPGHLYQTVYYYSQKPDKIRTILENPGYAEGWASYVEFYAYLMDTSIDPELAYVMSHNASSTLALYALLDIHINYDGWGKDETADFLKTYYGIEDPVITDEVFYKMVEEPASYLRYYVGYLEIIELRNKAEEVLKKKFDLLEFHRFILDMGPAQFGVIERHMNLWLEMQQHPLQSK